MKKEKSRSLSSFVHQWMFADRRKKSKKSTATNGRERGSLNGKAQHESTRTIESRSHWNWRAKEQNQQFKGKASKNTDEQTTTSMAGFFFLRAPVELLSLVLTWSIKLLFLYTKIFFGLHLRFQSPSRRLSRRRICRWKGFFFVLLFRLSMKDCWEAIKSS